MISLQAHIVKWICRFFVKRALMKPVKSPMHAIRRLRRSLSLWDPLNSAYTRGLGIQHLSGPVRGEWLVPPGAKLDRAILYVHGGAFVACSPLTHRRLTTALSKRSGVPLFAVKYRLAPEHPFPAPLDDVLAAYDMLRARGIPASGIVIAGDSAGGNLALAATLAISQRARPERIGGLLAYSPWTDLLGTGESLVTNNVADDMLVGTGVAESARSYAATAADARNPLASPLYGDLAGFPETLVFVGSTEVLLDDSRRFVARAKAAGVAATLEIFPKMPHVWQVWYDVLPEARVSVERSAGFVRSVLSRGLVDGAAPEAGGSSPLSASSGRG